jgi:hypothetical protein
MAKPFTFANDGLSLGLPILVELVDRLYGSSMGDVSHLALAKETVQHAAAGQQPDVPLVERRHEAACHLLLFAHQNPATFCIATDRCSASSISSSGSPV